MHAPTRDAMSNPLLAGIRVLDLSRLLPGPFCSLMLAQLGAEVIKIEEPDGGDYTRSMSPEMFGLLNRGKKSVVLDLRRKEDAETLKRLVEDADVLLESFRPGVMERFDCGYETLRKINPRLVYAALTGYGHTGPYRDRAGHDMNYCATAGVLDQIGEASGPAVLSNVQIADIAGGSLTCAVGILAAVIGARGSGKGCFVDVGMLDGTLALQQVALATLRTHGKTQPRGEDMLTGALANYSLYKCRDGRYLAVGSLEPKFFARVLEGIWELAPAALRVRLKPPRKSKSAKSAGKTEAKAGTKRTGPIENAINGAFSHPAKARRTMAPVRWALAGIFRLKTAAEWERVLEPYDACVSAVLTLDEALRNEQVQARELVETVDGKPAIRNPIHFVGAQTRSGTAPALGADTAEVLAGIAERATS